MSSVPSISAFAAVHTRHHDSHSHEQSSETDKPENPSASTNPSSINKAKDNEKSTFFGMFGSLMEKFNFVGHDGVSFGGHNDESSSRSNSLEPPEDKSLLSRLRHFSGASTGTTDEPIGTPTEKK